MCMMKENESEIRKLEEKEPRSSPAKFTLVHSSWTIQIIRQTSLR